MKPLRTISSALLACTLSTCLPLLANSLDLSGTWKFSLDAKDLGLAAGPSTWDFPDTINLPGSTAAQSKGPEFQMDLKLDKETMNRLRERHPYVGPAWYQREIRVPDDWRGDHDSILILERVLWESRVWVDKQPVGAPQNSLSAPHRYDLTGYLKPGQTHTLTLRIDNRQMVPIGDIGHAYTAGTQTIWNGVIGDLEIQQVPKARIDDLRIMTRSDGTMKITAAGDFPPRSRLSVSISEPGATSTTRMPTVKDLGQSKTFVARFGAAKPWSELSPTLYQLEIQLLDEDGQPLHQLTRTIGFRDFTAKGRDLLINGQPTFLRGNLECAIFPQTGHPDAEGPQWEKIMQVSRDHGLNHLRFHSWCPPEAAFEAADRHGIYLQVELPNWTFEMGKNPPADEFFKAEGERIFREYGHHPSFVMFSLGNELKGNLKHMDALIGHFREIAPDMLFTSTSYAFSPRGLLPGPEDDFFITQRSKSGWVRGQGFLNTTFPSTDTDYAEGLECLEIPLVTHEVGQYVVYPNLAELPKYEDTPLRSTALEVIKQDLEAKSLLDDAERFTRDSGKLAALLYKEDIERALRTKGLAGIQLLQLQDFPGQSTATVGLLDAFWDSKGVITADEFRQFSDAVVPLARMEKFVWENSETFTADLELANFSELPLDAVGFSARLIAPGGEVVAEQAFDARRFPLGNGLEIGAFRADLSAFTRPVQLTLEVSGPSEDITNSWPIWVYPRNAPAAEKDLIIHRGTTEECMADLAAGKSVLLLPPSGAVRKSLPARFIPVFWSPLHFPNQPGTLGATIETDHPLWNHFPTDSHTNWQWWELTATSTAVDLSGVDASVAKPFRFIDKYDRNALPTGIFEARVGPGKLLVCTLDVESRPDERIVARQLKRALIQRIQSSDFNPSGVLSPSQLQELIGETSLVVTASSAHSTTPASHAADGDPTTLWHTDWTTGEKLPADLTIDLLGPKPILGLRCTQRKDMENGRVSAYEVEVSIDGSKWLKIATNGKLANSGNTQEIRFKDPIKARYLRLSILRDHGNRGFASMAEIEPLLGDPGDVRDLGIIPGFND
ncbi:discoidin domain-containing protein [Haloferula rosea]|uniref:Discoidin domain-containing protein n=1 Tax=Haloferula rosea TaxID=490093 RepID=A0A934RB64_9BACT|nr:discoidin domain-containing protein [Haloferula rosea]MBK1827320.1 discoidin domain-containing protein [Haloferula rosea]